MFKVKLGGLEHLDEFFEDIGAHLTDMSEVFSELGELLQTSTKDRMVDSVSPDGTPYAPKSEVTKRKYQRNRKTPVVEFRPLFGESGRLRNEIIYILGLDRQSLELGSNMIYAGVMQRGAAQGAFGTTTRGNPIPWGNIPARPFIGLSDEDETGIRATLEEWLDRVALRAGAKL